MPHHLSDSLEKRRKEDAYRTLKQYDRGIDFCSNDYLGFARSYVLKQRFMETLAGGDFKLGATGSRLITGNSLFTEELETRIAAFHGAEAGLLYNSGYDANLGLLSCLPQRGDTVITDQLVHASIIDGIRLNHAERLSFAHNDPAALEEKLAHARGTRYVVVESVYSMDGDHAPLNDIAGLCREYGARLIVDEAHATGVFGRQGRGLVCDLNLEEHAFARIVTFGKALGTHGAIVLGSALLREYLINFSRSFIYTTAAPPYLHQAIRLAYGHLEESDHVSMLKDKIMLFREQCAGLQGLISSHSAIQSIIIQGNTKARELASRLNDAGFEVKAILSPTVPAGQERLRICLHLYNSNEEIISLATYLKNLI